MPTIFLRRCLLLLSLLASGAYAGAPSPALDEALAAYKIYVTGNVHQLVADTGAFTAAVIAGDIAQAKRLYAPTRSSFERIEPVAELFPDLDRAIDARADDHERAEQDPAFGGFHRIEHGLWVHNSSQNLGPVADQLMADVLALQQRVGTLAMAPEKVVGGAAALMEEVAAGKISGEENRYSHTDLWDFQANTEGAHHIVGLLRPLLVPHKLLLGQIDANFQAVFDTLAKYRNADGSFQSYTKLGQSDRRRLAGRVNTLAEDLSKLRGLLGLP